VASQSCAFINSVEIEKLKASGIYGQLS
jgi:hypothetical protein